MSRSAVDSRRRTLRAAFSLVEMMIALVLLGLGMVLVATMFPVAWTRARQLNEMTNLSSVVNAAETAVRTIARVDGRDSDFSTFAGDLVFVRNNTCGWSSAASPLGGIFSLSDTRVHSLALDNLRVVNRRLLSSDPWDDQPWTFNRIDAMGFPQIDPNDLQPCGLIEGTLFTSRSLPFEARFHPPVRPHLNGSYSDPNADPEWDQMVDSRRYLWSVLHRLNHRIEGDLPLAEESLQQTVQRVYDAVNSRRDFTMYYVMLRRPQPTYRYARQDPSTVPALGINAPVAPKALPVVEDVMLPEAWRVQLYFNLTGAVRNLPTEAEVNNPSSVATDPMLVDLFPAGAWFIDEESGLIIQVVKRRIAEGPAGTFAVLTLDQELHSGITGFDNGPQLRTVWVFPPPVQPIRRGTGQSVPIFEGSQPVVTIVKSSLSLSPVN